jgi:hypothetical protein
VSDARGPRRAEGPSAAAPGGPAARAAAWPESWPAWAWLLVGAALRLLWPSDFLFKHDEARNLDFALAIAREGQRPAQAWPTSLGLPNGPVAAYCFALVTRFAASPLAVNSAVALANVGALALAIPLYRRLLGRPRDARLALALHATSPVAIWFSRKIWDPCLLALFVVPALACLLAALQSRRSRLVALEPPLLALAIQVHHSAIFLAVVVASLLLRAGRRIAWGWLAAGCAAGAALAAPYARALSTHVAAHGVRADGGSRFPDIDVVTNLFLDASGHNVLQFAGRDAPALLAWPLPPIGLLVVLAGVPFYVAVFDAYAKLLRRGTDGDRCAVPATAHALGSDTAAATRAIRWLAAGVPLLYLAARVAGTPHYFLVIQPILFALVVVGARSAEARLAGPAAPAPAAPPPSRRLLDALRPRPAALVGANVALWLLFASYIHAHWGGESYGLPYGRLVTACARVAAEARARGLGAADRPLALEVAIWREKGALPRQYEHVLRERFGIHVEPPAPGATPHLALSVAWRAAGRLGRPPFEVRPGR